VNTLQDFIDTWRADESFNYPELRYALSQNPAGVACEFGVSVGTSAKLIAAQLPLYGFDCWTGLPEDWYHDGQLLYPKGAFAADKPHIPNTTFVDGLFADTLPRFDWPNNIGLIHVDCDLYSSSQTVFRYAGPHLNAGCLIVLDNCEPESELQRAWSEVEPGLKYTEAPSDSSGTRVLRLNEDWT
jgi:hypothetical protein